MKKRKFFIFAILIVLILFSGCSSKDEVEEETLVLETENNIEISTETTSIPETETVVQTTTQAQTQAPTQPPTVDLYTEAANNKSNYWSYYQEVLNYINGYRSEVGAAPLVLSDELCMAASVRAAEMLRGDYFEHLRPDGRSWSTVLGEFSISYSSAGENIAKGYGDVAAVCNGWYNSDDGHYEAMVNSGYNKLGVGIAFITPTTGYWVQIFTN